MLRSVDLNANLEGLANTGVRPWQTRHPTLVNLPDFLGRLPRNLQRAEPAFALIVLTFPAISRELCERL